MIEATLPIETVSEANSSEHWTAKSKRHKLQQLLIRVWFSKLREVPALPVVVTLVRLSSRELDGDNLQISMKYLRDELSELLIPHKAKTALAASGKRYKLKGRQDMDKRIKWLYGQEKSKFKGVRIRIESDPDIN